MKYYLLLLFFICSPKILDAQAPTPLTPTSKYVCISGSEENLIGKTNETSFTLISAKKVRTTLSNSRVKLQEKLALLKDGTKLVKKGNISGGGLTGVVKAMKKIIKQIGDGRDLTGDKTQQLEVLEYNINLVKNLVILANAEIKALSDCINKKNTNGPPGTYTAKIVAIPEAKQVIAVLVADDRQVAASARYCIKKNSDPALPAPPSSGYGFSSNPCNSGSCEGKLGSHMIGLPLGGIHFSFTPTQEEIDAAVGQLIAEFGSAVIKSG